MKNEKLINMTLYVGIAIFSIVIFRRCNEWHNRLTGENGKLTVAHVFNSYQIKSAKYYNYLYKIGENFYSESTSGSNVNNFKDNPVQCFLVAYDQTDPTIHTVIWSYKYDSLIPLGKLISGIPNKNELIKNHTLGWNGLSPRADKNDWNEINEYKDLK